MVNEHGFGKLKFAVFLVILLSCPSLGNAASGIAGCDEKIMDMLKDEAEAKVAYDVARIDETLEKPESVLKTVCFGSAMAVSAKSTGKIMSGDYLTKIEKPVNAALKSYGITDNLASSSATDDCTEMADMVDKYETDKRKPLPTFSEVVANDTSKAASGSDFKKVVDSSASTFQKIKENRTALFSNMSGAASAPTDVVAVDPGVSQEIQKAMLLQFDLHEKYDRAVATQLVDKPGSVAAISCFNDVLESFAKGGGGLFSGDYTKQIEAPIKDGLESFFSNFSWDDVVSYDANIAVTASLSIGLDLGVDIASEPPGGPTIKGVECEEMQKKWETDRQNGVQRPLTFNDAVRKMVAGTDAPDEDFNRVWQSDSDTKGDVAELETNTTPVFTIDNPIMKGDDLCAVLTKMGVSNDCGTVPSRGP